jgi:hypothetical protein
VKATNNERAASALENVFNLNELDDFIDEKINLAFDITAPFWCEQHFSNGINRHFLATIEVSIHLLNEYVDLFAAVAPKNVASCRKSLSRWAFDASNQKHLEVVQPV